MGSTSGDEYNMEICDFNSYTHDLINILFKQIE